MIDLLISGFIGFVIGIIFGIALVIIFVFGSDSEQEEKEKKNDDN